MKRILRTILIAAGLLVATIAVLVTATVAALPTIADHVPLELSRDLVTDGRRTVEMQGMVHVAHPAFYREIADLVAQRRREGWLVFYEEVRPDHGPSPEQVAEVLRRLGANWNPESHQHPYEMVAGIIAEGLVLQDNRALLGPPGPDVRNVDVTLSQLLAALPPASAEDDGEEEGMDLAEVRDGFAKLPDWAKARVRAAVRIALAVSARDEMTRDMLPPALTTMREKLVSDAIRAEPDRNILILYGQVHIDHIRALLAASNPSWRVTSSQSVRAF